MYSSSEGLASNWHFVHATTRAIGGAGVFMIEATAVDPEGRISPSDMGIWGNAHVEALKPITKCLQEYGCAAGIQLAHAGRKASCNKPWEGGKQLALRERGWNTIAPSAIAHQSGDRSPKQMDVNDIQRVVSAFKMATQRAFQAGFQILEIHMAHGYLLHSFLSPISNLRKDEYGGTFENRIRLPLEVVRVVRRHWPDSLPLWIRLNCQDWIPGGWDLEQAITFSRLLKEEGVDLIDCSSGFISPDEEIDFGAGFQVSFAEAVRSGAEIATAAVGGITESSQAETILRNGMADLVCLGREFLREPYWPIKAARELGFDIDWPVQYLRAAQ